jgi:hypothetical protein
MKKTNNIKKSCNYCKFKIITAQTYNYFEGICDLYNYEIFGYNEEYSTCKYFYIVNIFSVFINLWFKIVAILRKNEVFEIIFDYFDIVLYNVRSFNEWFNETDNKILKFWFKLYIYYIRNRYTIISIKDNLIIYKNWWNTLYACYIVNEKIFKILSILEISINTIEKTIIKETSIKNPYLYTLKNIKVKNPNKEYKKLLKDNKIVLIVDKITKSEAEICKILLDKYFDDLYNKFNSILKA